MEYDGFIFQIYNIHWCLIFFMFIGFKTWNSKFIFISMGNYLQFQIWVSDQSKSGFVYFYWLFTELLCVISDILIECIGFPENFTKLLEKSYRTTYFINKIEKTFRRWLQHFCRQLNRSPHKKPSDFLAVETPYFACLSLSWLFPEMTMMMIIVRCEVVSR